MIKRIRSYIQYLKAYVFDMELYRKSKGEKYELQNLQRWILLKVHSMEKGLSFINQKEKWGHDNAKILIDNLSNYLNIIGKHDELSVVALNVLNLYKDNKNAMVPELISERIDLLNRNYPLDKFEVTRGIRTIDDNFRFNKKEIINFFFSRHSVRSFSEKEIKKEDIDAAIEFASCTPSACNRQTANVYVIKDKEKINKVLDNQFGNQGWTDKASVLFVVTSNLSLFWGLHERRQPYIDGGLYAMNLVYGLHLNNIATCYREFSAIPDREIAFKKMCGIPDNEVPIVMIAAGYYNGQSCSPLSERFENKYTIV